jgi:hypothetical protein
MALRRRRSAWGWIEAALWTVAVASALLISFSVADRALFRARQGRALDESLRAAEASRAAQD